MNNYNNFEVRRRDSSVWLNVNWRDNTQLLENEIEWNSNARGGQFREESYHQSIAGEIVFYKFMQSGFVSVSRRRSRSTDFVVKISTTIHISSPAFDELNMSYNHNLPLCRNLNNATVCEFICNADENSAQFGGKFNKTVCPSSEINRFVSSRFEASGFVSVSKWRRGTIGLYLQIVTKVSSSSVAFHSAIAIFNRNKLPSQNKDEYSIAEFLLN